nr:MAG: ORF2 [Torque teno polar bear virus 37]
MSSPETLLRQLSPEEHWLVSITASHRLWCDCKDYRRHIPGWPGDGGDGGDAGASGAPVEGGVSAAEEVTDAELAAVTFDLGFQDLEDASG